MKRDSFMKYLSTIEEENPGCCVNAVFSDDKNREAVIELHENGYFFFCEPYELDEIVYIPININMVRDIEFKKEMHISDWSEEDDFWPFIWYLYDIHFDYVTDGLDRRFSMSYSSEDLVWDGSRYSINYEQHIFKGLGEFAGYLRNKRYLQEALEMLTSKEVLEREHETIKEHGFSLIGRINYQNIVTLLEHELNYNKIFKMLIGCPTAFYIETNTFAERIKAVLSIWDCNKKNSKLLVEDFLIEDLFERSELMGDSALYRLGTYSDDYWNDYIEEWLPLEITQWMRISE